MIDLLVHGDCPEGCLDCKADLLYEIDGLLTQLLGYPRTPVLKPCVYPPSGVVRYYLEQAGPRP